MIELKEIAVDKEPLFTITTTAYADKIKEMVLIETIAQPYKDGKPFYVVSEIPMNKDLIPVQEAKFKSHISTVKRYLSMSYEKNKIHD